MLAAIMPPFSTMYEHSPNGGHILLQLARSRELGDMQVCHEAVIQTMHGSRNGKPHRLCRCAVESRCFPGGEVPPTVGASASAARRMTIMGQQ